MTFCVTSGVGVVWDFSRRSREASVEIILTSGLTLIYLQPGDLFRTWIFVPLPPFLELPELSEDESCMSDIAQGLWALVNNAGILGVVRPVELCDKEDYIKVFNVNLLGPVEMTRQFLPLVRKSRGRIVTITSAYGRFAAIGAPYCASKFGLEAYSDILRRDVWDQGLKVSIIEPGGFLTSLLCVDNLRKDINQCLERAAPDMRNLYQSSFAPWVVAMDGSTFISSSLRPVVDAYTHAITPRFPCNRYVVGLDAQLVYIPLSYMPDWFCDWLLRMLAKLAQIKYL